MEWAKPETGAVISKLAEISGASSRVLVTSRDSLNLYNEIAWALRRWTGRSRRHGKGMSSILSACSAMRPAAASQASIGHTQSGTDRPYLRGSRRVAPGDRTGGQPGPDHEPGSDPAQRRG